MCEIMRFKARALSYWKMFENKVKGSKKGVMVSPGRKSAHCFKGERQMQITGRLNLLQRCCLAFSFWPLNFGSFLLKVQIIAAFWKVTVSIFYRKRMRWGIECVFHSSYQSSSSWIPLSIIDLFNKWQNIFCLYIHTQSLPRATLIPPPQTYIHTRLWK